MCGGRIWQCGTRMNVRNERTDNLIGGNPELRKWRRKIISASRCLTHLRHREQKQFRNVLKGCFWFVCLPSSVCGSNTRDLHDHVQECFRAKRPRWQTHESGVVTFLDYFFSRCFISYPRVNFVSTKWDLLSFDEAINKSNYKDKSIRNASIYA